MDRLTKILEDGQVAMDCDACKASGFPCSLYGCRQRLMKRLADYENAAEQGSPIPIRTGHWILVATHTSEDGEEMPIYRCSACSIPRNEQYRYCPSCGAKMVNL